MIFNQTTHKDLRDLFCNAVTKVFVNSEAFLDFIEEMNYSIAKYDCYFNYGGENYIINRQTGEYINWYKFDHIGRDIHISSTFHMHKNMPAWFEEFLTEFKESGDKS